MASRTAVAEYLAGQLTAGRSDAVTAAAAWLVSKGRRRQAAYLAGDVATVLASDGYLLARLTTARPLNDVSRQSIITFLKTKTGATTIELDEIVDPSVIGGLHLATPTAELDATVRRRLVRLVEGAHQ